MTRAWLLALALLAACGDLGCLSTSPSVPVTPANQAQVNTCESVGSLHNEIVLGILRNAGVTRVLGGYVLGGATSALGGVSALESATGVKNALAISAAIAGAVGVIDTAFAAFTGQEYSANRCTDVTGVLPLGHARAPDVTTVEVTK